MQLKIFIILILLISNLPLLGQENTYKTVVNKNNGDKIIISSDEIDSITFVCNDEIINSAPQIEVRKIYGNGTTYCAFTSLIMRDNTFYLAFREGASHVAEGDYGVIRILQSKDGDTWSMVQTLSLFEVDLRDPCLSVTPDGFLFLICGARIRTPEGNYTTKTYCAKEYLGKFGEVMPALVPNEIDSKYCCWIWRLEWIDKEGYGVAYRSEDGVNRQLTLLKTVDGINYSIVKELELDGRPSETMLRFLPNGTMIALIRRDDGSKKGFIGKSKFPYDKWELKELNVYLAGHDFVIDDNKIICSTRISENIGDKTNICFGNLEGEFAWSYSLPSSGYGSDTSYASIIDMGIDYWISYYSMHENKKPCIYLAKMPKRIIPY